MKGERTVYKKFGKRKYWGGGEGKEKTRTIQLVLRDIIIDIIFVF